MSEVEKAHFRYEISSFEPILHYSECVSKNGNCFFFGGWTAFVQMQSQVTMDPHVGPGLGDSEVSRQKADCCNDPCNCLLAKDAAFERRMRRGCQRGVLLWAEIFSEAFLQRGRSHLQDHSPFALFLVPPIAFWVWFCSRLVFRCCLFGVYYASGIVLSSIHTHLVKTLLRNWR